MPFLRETEFPVYGPKHRIHSFLRDKNGQGLCHCCLGKFEANCVLFFPSVDVIHPQQHFHTNKTLYVELLPLRLRREERLI